MIKSVKKYLDAFKGLPYIFNLGHGMLPETDPVKVLETFHLAESSSKFQDFICIWQKVEQNEEINCNRVSDNIILRVGAYETHLVQNKNIESDSRIWFK